MLGLNLGPRACQAHALVMLNYGSSLPCVYIGVNTHRIVLIVCFPGFRSLPTAAKTQHLRRDQPGDSDWELTSLPCLPHSHKVLGGQSIWKRSHSCPRGEAIFQLPPKMQAVLPRSSGRLCSWSRRPWNFGTQCGCLLGLSRVGPVLEPRSWVWNGC